jgi:glycosyltransferase 2 family protein
VAEPLREFVWHALVCYNSRHARSVIFFMKDIRNKVILGGLFGLAVLLGLLLYSDIHEVGAHLQTFPILFVVPILCLTLWNYAVRWVKWHYYLKVIGVSGIGVIDSMALFVSGFVLALSPGKVAELLKAAVLRAMTGTPIARSAPVIVAERITDGLAMLLLAAIGAGGMLANAQQQQAQIVQYIPAYFAVFGVLIAGIIAIQIRPLILWLLHVMERLPLLRRLSHTLHELYEASYLLFRPKPLFAAVGLGIVSWAGECAAFFLILVGLGIEPGWLLLWQATFILAASSIIGAVSGLPGGLGAAEFTIVGMVQLLILHDSDSGLAGTAAILVRLCTLWYGAGLGVIIAVVFRKRLLPEQIAEIWQASKQPQIGDASV